MPSRSSPYNKETDPEALDRSYEFYRRAGFWRELMISEPEVQGILDFFSETIPEVKKAKPLQFVDDRPGESSRWQKIKTREK